MKKRKLVLASSIDLAGKALLYCNFPVYINSMFPSANLCDDVYFVWQWLKMQQKKASYIFLVHENSCCLWFHLLSSLSRFLFWMNSVNFKLYSWWWWWSFIIFKFICIKLKSMRKIFFFYSFSSLLCSCMLLVM